MVLFVWKTLKILVSRIKARSRALQATLTSGSNFRTLFAILHKSCRCTYGVRSRLVEGVSFTGEFFPLEIRIGLLSSPCICNLSLLEKKKKKCSSILNIEVMNRCNEEIGIWICIMSVFVTFGYLFQYYFKKSDDNNNNKISCWTLLIIFIRKNERTSKCLQKQEN